MSSSLFVLLILCYLSHKGFATKREILPPRSKYFELSIIHMNDFHARFVEEAENIGGLPRVVTAVRGLLEKRPNPIFLNAGDYFQGTIWYEVHRWNATSYFMNMLPHDAMTLGNHDFDNGLSGLIPFLKQSKAPIVVANIDDSEEPSIKGLCQNSTIIERDGEKIGIIGVVTADTMSESMTGKLRLLDEVRAINTEAKKLKAQGVDIIIVLSHIGFREDKKLANECPDVDVIVGGHSHTFLYTGSSPKRDIPEDRYPVVVIQKNTNRKVLIVQAASNTKYLGNLTVWFDQQGEVVNWEGNPIALDASIEQDKKMLENLKPWEQIIDERKRQIIAETKVDLNAASCKNGECNLANVLTDSMVHAFKNQNAHSKSWSTVAIACVNSSGIRTDIPIGNITFGNTISLQPINNKLRVIEIQGKDLKIVLEKAVLISKDEKKFVGSGLLHWSGVKVVYNISRPAFNRVIDLQIRCQACVTPKFEKLDENYWYRVVAPAYLIDKAGPHRAFTEIIRSPDPERWLSRDLLVDYVKTISPVKDILDHRMTIVGEWRG